MDIRTTTFKRSLAAIDERVEKYLRELGENDKKEAGVKTPDKKELKDKIDSLKDRKDKYQELLKKMKSTNTREISLTDPDARAMLTSQKVQVSYNIQTTVDKKYKLILDNEVTNEDRKSTRLNSSHTDISRMPSSA